MKIFIIHAEELKILSMARFEKSIQRIERSKEHARLILCNLLWIVQFYWSIDLQFSRGNLLNVPIIITTSTNYSTNGSIREIFVIEAHTAMPALSDINFFNGFSIVSYFLSSMRQYIVPIITWYKNLFLFSFFFKEKQNARKSYGGNHRSRTSVLTMTKMQIAQR